MDSMKLMIQSSIIICLFFVLFCAGCQEETNTDNNESTYTEDNFYGTWYNQEGTPHEFAANGTYYANGFKLGTWSFENNKFIIIYNSGLDFFMDYQFSDNDNTLILTSSSGVDTIYTRSAE